MEGPDHKEPEPNEAQQILERMRYFTRKEFSASVHGNTAEGKWNWKLVGAAGVMEGPGFSGDGAEERAWESLLARIKDVYATNKK